jgi:hypothetical protein
VLKQREKAKRRKAFVARIPLLRIAPIRIGLRRNPAPTRSPATANA